MASMGSLGHYMQEASRAGFAIRDFLHEGNGDIWLAALNGPRPFVGWLLLEEKAEGGDMLARIAREKPSFLDGYERVCEGAGLALYGDGNVRRIAGSDLGFAVTHSSFQLSLLALMRFPQNLNVHREVVREAAEVDRRAGEILLGGILPSPD